MKGKHMQANKNETQIEKEKMAVSKMVGAKSAMQLMIDRNNRLVEQLTKIRLIAEDVGKNVGHLAYKTHNHGQKNAGTFAFMTIREQMDRIEDMVREVK